MRLGYLFLFLAIIYCSNAYSQVKSEDDLKKQAEKHFEEDEYSEAYKLYSQLVSLYPKDPEYNYRLGVCMLFTEPDKKKPYSYFQIALRNPTEAPKDLKFYLAKTYHVNYKFDEALKLYTEFKKTASAVSIKKLQVDREIEACRNGKRLLSNLSDLVIINKKQLNEADYFRSYDLKDIGGKLLVKSADFQTALDKRKKDKSVIYLPRNGERIYYSSYGDNGDRGRDIYFVNRLPNGGWSKPQIMPGPANTEYDEDYPFLHPNGKTLYFSSKGHNSMGGYDVFKTTFDDATNTWSKPVNLDFPINSPDDDILFVTDSLEKTAFFSTGRYSPYGKIDVLKINTERRPMNFAVVKGTVVKEEATQSIKSKITVKNMANGEIVGSYQAQDNGDYYMELPNGGKFIFTVETPGIPTQSDGVQIPVAYNLKPYKQVISYDKKVLKIINYFDGQVADENYSVMIDLIEKKAHLEINEMDPYNNSLKDATIKNQNATAGNNGNNDLNSVSTTNPTITSDSGNKNNNATNTNKNVTNDQLLNIAKDDAKEAAEESTKLKQEAQDAFGLATQKTAEAVALQKEADDAFANANTITDVAKKSDETIKANKLKEDATIASNVANVATNLAKKLEVDANQKQKEADLTNQYIKQLEEVIKNKNNKEALTKLDQIQKDLDGLSKQKNQSDELLNSLKAEAQLKQTELTASEKKNEGILNEIKSIKNESEGLEKDMIAENDKSLKENIAAQIRELNNEIELKNKELTTNNQKIATLSNEVEGVNKELEIASKILNETNTTGVAITNNTDNNSNESTSINNTSNNGNANTSTSIEGLNKKYDDQLSSSTIDKGTKEGLTKQNEILKTYTKEATDLIALDKNTLTKTTDPEEKKRLNTEIKSLEKLKTDNEKLIAANNTKVKQLETAIANNNNATNESGNAITNNNSNNSSNTNSTSIDNGNNGNTNTTSGNQIDNTNSSANTNTTGIATNNGNTTNANNTTAIENNSSNNGSNTANTNGNENTNGNSANTNTTAIANNNNASNNSNNGNAIDNNNTSSNNTTNAIDNSNNTYNNNGNSNAITNNNGNENSNSNGNTIANNNTAVNNEAIKPISTNAGTDNSAYLNELNNLKNSLNSGTAEATNLFAYNNYKENTSLTLKQAATQKFDAAKQNENDLNNLIAKTETAIKSASANNATSLVNEADALNNKAFELRKESATKTGAEKDALINEAIANERTAVSKKLEASVAQQKQNKLTFDSNLSNLDELKKLTGTKTSNEISQANMLIDEAAINFKQAQKIRSETEFYPSDAAKLGGLSNAEEKENEALFKQQKAQELLAKVNPGFKPKTIDSGNPANAIESLNNEIVKTSQSQLDAYLALSKANQNELTLQGNKVANNATVKNGSNAQAKDLKTTSDNLNKEAKALIGQSLTAKTNAEKANLLLQANNKEIEALKVLTQATEALTTGAVAANTTNATNTNTISTNNTNGNETAINNNANTSNKDNSNTTGTNNNTAANTTNANETAVNNNTTTNSNNTTTNGNENTNTARTNTIANTSGNENTASSNTIAANSNNDAGNNNATDINDNNNAANNNSASISGKGVGDEAAKLKAGLNNNKENFLSEFNAYTNSEAIALKDGALTKIKAALEQDQTIKSQLDNVKQLAGTSGGTTLSQGNITALVSEADKLNDQAFQLRKAAAAKTGVDKDKDINEAKALEQQAVAKKIDAATKQQQLNTATYQANKQSLEELAALAKGKNIGELATAEKDFNDANNAFKQANDLRAEANALPSDAAKLGGYSNAEEKETLALAKQQVLLDTYKKYFSNYIPKQPSVAADSPEAVAKLNETKTTLNTNNQQHIDGLTQLVQANEKEYKNRFIALPTTLNTKQTGLKTSAQNAYKRNQTLLAEASQTTDLAKKKNLLIDASQAGQEAISNLNQITDPNAVALNTNSGGNNSNTNNTTAVNNNTATNTNSANNNSAGNNTTATNNTNAGNNNTAANNNNAGNTTTSGNNNTTGNNAANTVKIKVEGMDIKTNNAYSAAKPIPIDEKMPDGLVFKVQIGAFKAPLPDNTFKGLSPVSAQTTPNGYLRYMAGNFEKYESASAVKNDLRTLGYTDAFVVVYLNGKRITLAEALEKLKAEGKPVDVATNTSAGITSANVPRNPFPTNPTVANTTTDTQPAEITKELEQMNGLLYTIQIGVYSKQATRAQLGGLRPIYTEKLPNGLYRYTAGIYIQSQKLKDDKLKVVNLGVRDAFISAYYNSKRIPFAEAQKIQLENSNLKLETENPIIFPGSSGIVVPTNNTTTQPVTNTTANTNTPTVAAFSNGVTTGPAPTAENGVKTDDVGISYKVQIGAYKNQVPNDVASKFLNIKTWPVNNVSINGLYIYTIGNFTGISFAKKLKDEAISVGITDAFISVYKDGKKLYGAEAAQYMNQ